MSAQETGHSKVFFAAGTGGAREHAIAKALRGGGADITTTARTLNPGIRALTLPRRYRLHDETDVKWAAKWARNFSPDYAFIGSEQPLVAGIVDRLDQYGIPAVGPSAAAAQIEGSKLFLRNLMSKYNIPGSIEYHHFTDVTQVEEFLRNTRKEYAIKPLGLTGGKGVKVMGDQLTKIDEAVNYARFIMNDDSWGKGGILLEERIIGPEFTLQVFTDGLSVVPMPLVRDYKKAYEGDIGPNTGSMGDYSQEDGLLPFISQEESNEALKITKQITRALALEGAPYRGVMYSQFMKTAKGIKLIEINCRFGDPEGINVLSLLKNNLDQVSRAIIEGRLHEINLEFDKKATVVKYVAPRGYPENPEENVRIEINEQAIEELGSNVFYAQVRTDGRDSYGGRRRGDFYRRVLTTKSRIAAILGVGSTVKEAEEKAEIGIALVQGRHYVRHDIGREELLERDRRYNLN